MAGSTSSLFIPLFHLLPFPSDWLGQCQAKKRCWPWRCLHGACGMWKADGSAPCPPCSMPQDFAPLERGKDLERCVERGELRRDWREGRKESPLCVHVKCYLVVQLRVRFTIYTHTHTNTHTQTKTVSAGRLCICIYGSRLLAAR